MPEPNFNCDYCGNAGYNSPSRMKRNHKNFCSKDCSSKYRSKKIEVFCNCCGSDTLKSVILHLRHFHTNNYFLLL